MNIRKGSFRWVSLASAYLMPAALLCAGGCGGPNWDLYAAIQDGKTEKAVSLIAEGRPVNQLIPFLNESVLFKAVSEGQEEVVAALLNAGADPDLKNANSSMSLHSGEVPLHQARLGAARLLLAAGAKVDTRDSEDDTPLMHAAEWHRLDVVRLLLDHGADINAQNKNGSCALSAACRLEGNDSIVVDELLRRGADANIKDKDEWTPLMHAAAHQYCQAVTALTKHGADVRARSQEGLTALMLASREGSMDCVIVLVAGGADLHAQTADHGWTALHFAAGGDHVDVADYLIDLGVGAQPVSDTADGLYATAVSNKLLARHTEDKGDMQLAEQYYRVAGDHYEKAAASYDGLAKQCGELKTRAALTNLAGLALGVAVTGAVAQANYNATGSTYTGTLGTGAGRTLDTSGLSLLKAQYERNRDNCTKHAAACGQMVECHENGVSGPDADRRVKAARESMGLLP